MSSAGFEDIQGPGPACENCGGETWLYHRYGKRWQSLLASCVRCDNMRKPIPFYAGDAYTSKTCRGAHEKYYYQSLTLLLPQDTFKLLVADADTRGWSVRQLIVYHLRAAVKT